ncbi:ABC transporter ATP-binding protein, partial [Rhizobium leguminosarum]
SGTTNVHVEQDLARPMSVASRVSSMLEGRIVLDRPAAADTREHVTQAYFGLHRTSGDRSAS